MRLHAPDIFIHVVSCRLLDGIGIRLTVDERKAVFGTFDVNGDGQVRAFFASLPLTVHPGEL